MTDEQCTKETKKHQDKVKDYTDFIAKAIMSRGKSHDASKLKSPELEIFAEYSDKLKGVTYGSSEYKECLENMKVATSHHYEVNRHHPEHFENGVKDMNLVDIVEMLCDWKAASERHANGDVMESIRKSKIRFGMSDDLTKILLNTAKIL